MLVSSLLALALVSPAVAGDEPKTQVPTYKKRTIIDFDKELEIGAELTKPTGESVTIYEPPKGPTLVALRKDFNREMKQSTALVK